jgi:hypothetical protein
MDLKDVVDMGLLVDTSRNVNFMWVTLPNGTPKFDWFWARFVVKDDHQKDDDMS